MIKGAGDGEVIFDGDGAYNLFNVMAANYNYFEGITIRNTDLAFQAGLKNITGSSGLTIKRSRFENVGRAIYTDWSGSKDYYIADNMMLGRFNPNYLMGFTGRHMAEPARVQSEAGVGVCREGLRLRTRRGLQRHRELSRRRRCGDLRQPGWKSERRSAIACRSRSTFTGTTSPTWRTTASKPMAARTTSASSGTAASITGIARSACSRCSAGRCTSSATSSTTRLKVARSSSRPRRPGIVVYHNTFIAPGEADAAGGFQRALPKQSDPREERDARDFCRRDQYELLELGLQRLPSQRGRRVFLRVEHAADDDAAEFPGEPGRLSTQQQSQLEAQAEKHGASRR